MMKVDRQSEDRLQLLREFLKEDPTDEFTRFALAMEYRKLGQTADARRELETLVADSPEYVGTYYHLGSLYSESGDLDSARSVLEKGVLIAEHQRDHHAKSELKSALLDLDGTDPFD